MFRDTSKLTTIAANTSRRTSEMSNARSLVADPTASTETKILNGTSLAVTRMPERNADCISADFQDANSPRPDSQEKTIVKDTCDSVIILRSNRQEDFAEPAFSDDVIRIAAILFFISPGRRITWLSHAEFPSTDFRVIQEDLSLSEDREISATNWTDRCSSKWRLYNSEHSQGSCGFSEPSMLLSITGVQPRKLRVKDGRNAHGKVGHPNHAYFTSGRIQSALPRTWLIPITLDDKLAGVRNVDIYERPKPQDPSRS